LVGYVRLAYGIASGLRYPSLMGWVVEMDFVNQILDSTTINEVGSETGAMKDKERWKVNNVIHQFEVIEDHFKKVSEQPVDGCWILPAKWNQAAEDLVCLLSVNSNGGVGQKTFMIRFSFIHVTRYNS
jgi:hypothetical protein